MVSTDAIHTIVGSIGTVISLGLFLTPVPTYYSMYKKDAVEDLSPHPYFFSILSCAFWIYSCIRRHKSLLFVIMNGIGLAIGLIHVAMYLIHVSKKQRLPLVLAYACVSVCFLLVMVFFTFIPEKSRFEDLGYLCSCTSLSTFLTTMLPTVYATKSVDHVSIWLSLGNLLNGGCWITYGLFGPDNDIVLFSIVACILSVIQLIVYAYYSLRYPHSKNTAAGELQIPDVV
ncbi:hypothetical protein MKW94_009441 [Papaver nudicaule]|uniref:Bidirectional sugar transporter SWEET n=1 Tax=Papaver nudicaule TaxID=74823 RepID=A0AA41VTB2_PAPNU|nr:hypothetical protein [Papaver nudicaule]